MRFLIQGLLTILAVFYAATLLAQTPAM